MYDAINKDIKMATGDIVGILNADDVLASDDTLARIASLFEREGKRTEGRESLEGLGGSGGLRKSDERIDAVYADIGFVKDGDSLSELRSAKTVRYCSAARWRS